MNEYVNTINIRGNEFRQLNIPLVKRKLDMVGGVIGNIFNNCIYIYFPNKEDLESFKSSEFDELREAIDYVEMNYELDIDLTLRDKTNHIKMILHKFNIPCSYIGNQGEGELITAKPLSEDQVRVIKTLNSILCKSPDVFILMKENNLLELISICINESMYKNIVSYCDIKPDGSVNIMIESDKEKDIIHCRETLADYINNNIKEFDSSYSDIKLDVYIYEL